MLFLRKSTTYQKEKEMRTILNNATPDLRANLFELFIPLLNWLKCIIILFWITCKCQERKQCIFHVFVLNVTLVLVSYSQTGTSAPPGGQAPIWCLQKRCPLSWSSGGQHCNQSSATWERRRCWMCKRRAGWAVYCAPPTGSCRN